MNRLLICVAIIFFLCIPGFTQVGEEGFKSLLDFDGNDWMAMTNESKVMFIGGFALAQSAISVAVVDENNEFLKVSDEDQKRIADWLFLAANIYEIVFKVETWYRMTGRLDYPIWNVIYMAYDKHWWGKKTETNGDDVEQNTPIVPEHKNIFDIDIRDGRTELGYANFR